MAQILWEDKSELLLVGAFNDTVHYTMVHSDVISTTPRAVPGVLPVLLILCLWEYS